MPEHAIERRKNFLRDEIEKNEASHSEPALADMKAELESLESFTPDHPEFTPKITAISEPNPKSEDVQIQYKSD